MISGRANCSDDWPPARTRPVRGESFDSFCRRLAGANTSPRDSLSWRKGQVSVAVDTHFCRLRNAHAERRRPRDNTYHANTANTLAQSSGSRDLAVLRPVRPGAYIGLGTDRTMSITALRCEGSHMSGGVGDGVHPSSTVRPCVWILRLLAVTVTLLAACRSSTNSGSTGTPRGTPQLDGPSDDSRRGSTGAGPTGRALGRHSAHREQRGQRHCL